MTLAYDPSAKLLYRFRQPHLAQLPLRNRVNISRAIYSNRSSVNTPPRPLLLTSAINNSSQPKSHPGRALKPTTPLHYTPGPSSILPDPSIWGHRASPLLRYIRSNPHPHPPNHHTMRQPAGPNYCGQLFPILHPCRLHTPSCSSSRTN